MPIVSLNAFLKILTKSTPQKTTEYGRYLTPGGYDFYWRLKEATHSLTIGGESFSDCSRAISEIPREVERKHNLSGLKSLHSWLKKNEISEFFTAPVGARTSGEGHLTVKLEPDFGYVKNGQRRLVHCWAASSISLPRNAAGCGLHLLKEILCVGDFADCVPTILDLRKRELFVAEKLPRMIGPMVESEFAWADGFFKAYTKAA